MIAASTKSAIRPHFPCHGMPGRFLAILTHPAVTVAVVRTPSAPHEGLPRKVYASSSV